MFVKHFAIWIRLDKHTLLAKLLGLAAVPAAFAATVHQHRPELDSTRWVLLLSPSTHTLSVTLPAGKGVGQRALHEVDQGRHELKLEATAGAAVLAGGRGISGEQRWKVVCDQQWIPSPGIPE